MNLDTIIAQSTPSGSGAIAIIRLSGENVRKLVSLTSKLSSNKSILDINTHTINHGFILNENNEILDEVLFLIMDAPKSFTGENIIEITCHNNQFIIESIINRFCFLGARIARRGEFTFRAVENKKIDILQAEAINELIHANSENAVRASLSQLKGSLSNEISLIDEGLCTVAAWCQANFEFLDEERDFRYEIIKRIDLIINNVDNILNKYNISELIKKGIRVSILGTVNAGKSSLFNSLIDKSRAIVTNIPGTTRDVIEYSIFKNGFNWTFADTAGIRETNDFIEKEGIKRSFEESENSDIIILLYDEVENKTEDIVNFYKEIYKKYNNKVILVIGKNDKLFNFDLNKFKNFYKIKDEDKIYFFSNNNKDSSNYIWNELLLRINKENLNIKLPYIINKRHLSVLKSVKNNLENINKNLKNEIVHYEIILMLIHEAQLHLTDMSGRSISEASMNKVFSEFCVGK